MSDFTDEQIHLRLAAADHAVEVEFWERAGEPDALEAWDSTAPCASCMESSEHLVPTVRRLMADAWYQGSYSAMGYILESRSGIPDNPYKEVEQ